MVALEAGETIVRTGPVVWVGAAGPRPGTLSVTSHALVFEGPIPRPMQGGPPGAGRRPVTFVPGELRIALWRCRTASAANGPRGPLLEIELLARKLFFRADDVEGWVRSINGARATAPPAPEGALAGMRTPPGPGAGAMPRCEFCGHLNAAGSLKCQSCGAPF